MKKKFLLAIGLVLVLGICISVAIFSASGAETETVEAHRIAAQLYKKISNEDVSFDTESSDPDAQIIVGYYKDIPITRDQVAYRQAMGRVYREPEATEREAIFAVAKDLYTIEQAKDLGLYPSEEEMEEEFDSTTRSVEADLEENLAFCSQIGLTRDEWIAWMTQREIESLAKTRFMSQILTSLLEEQEVEDEALAELVQAFMSREGETDILMLVSQIYDRYVILQIGDQITYVNEDAGENSNVVSE